MKGDIRAGSVFGASSDRRVGIPGTGESFVTPPNVECTSAGTFIPG